MKKHFCVEAYISKLTTLVGDNTIRLTVDCQEMSPEREAELLRLKRKSGWFFFLESPEAEIDTRQLPDMSMLDGAKEKTPSQRMRAVIWRHWERTDKAVSFDQFYRDKMEGIIDYLKGKLD